MSNLTALPTSLLKAENLNISYKIGRNWIRAVREFRLTLQKSQVYGIVGESGSGKSTVATGIMRFLSANGRIEKDSQLLFNNDDLTQKSARQMRHLWGTEIKMVPQNPSAALNPSLKVGEQLAEVGRRHLNMNRQEAMQAAINMFQKVHLADPQGVANRYPHELSGGMQQRVVIAMALLTQPQLLVLDEPTTGLDVTTEAVILDLIRNLIKETEAGVVYVTHNLGVVAQFCERIAVMYAGEIMEDSPVSDLYRQPLHPYTIGLLNSIPKPGQSKYNASLLSIPGSPPSLTDLPQGCVFADRCPIAIEKCHTQKPPLEKLPASFEGHSQHSGHSGHSEHSGRSVRCFRWREIASGEADMKNETVLGIKRADTLTRDPLLSVTNLTKHFEVPRGLVDFLSGNHPAPVRAVDGINLGVQKGRTLGLVGESGSGKTTLSRVMIGLTDRTDGEIDLLGVKIRKTVQQRSKDVLAQLQMVFQNPQNSLNPYLTVRQALTRPLIKLAGFARHEANAEVIRLLEAVNLRAEYANRYPSELSGGEKQRVVIARAFASNPELIICDEPVSALDVSVQAAVLNLLARLQDQNETSYLFISHDLAVVGYLADYLAVMYLGQLFEVGYGEDMFAPPYHPYTEALISAIPVPDPDHKSERVLLSDNIPSPRNMPSGCRFHTRCPHKIGDICETDIPPWRDDGAGHYIRCHIPLDDLRAIQHEIIKLEDIQ